MCPKIFVQLHGKIFLQLHGFHNFTETNLCHRKFSLKLFHLFSPLFGSQYDMYLDATVTRKLKY